jgi:transcription antitermination factor NusG
MTLMPILPAEPEMYPKDLWEGHVRPDDDRRWYCLHTKPRQEKATARDLLARKLAFYLPQVVRESRTPAGRKILSIIPLFGGYLFLLGTEEDRIEALKANRLVNVLEVVDQEGFLRDLWQVRQMLASGMAIDPESTAPVGSRVRIASGPLMGLIGTVIRRGERDRFIAVVKTLGVGASVMLEDWQVEVLSE